MKNRFFIACLCIGLSLALFTGVFAVMGWGGALRRIGGGIAYPFQWLAARVQDGFSGFGRYFTDMESLRNEIDSLQAENESLREALNDAVLIRQEDEWLYRYLSMKEERDDWSLCAASVTAAAWTDGYATGLTLNKGSASGIRTGMPVVTDRGLVGAVGEVGLTWCKVRTILDTAHSAGAADVRSGETGMAEGSFSALAEGKLSFRYLPAEADIRDGDVVVTSGSGSVYPYGIPIGVAERVSANAYARTTEAVLVPFVGFDGIRQVMIVTDYEHTTGEVSP